MARSQYIGKLTPRQASEGILAAVANAESLLEDAILLFENTRYERSVALSILAIEEAGKLAILRMIFLEDDQNSLKKEWKNYRKHIKKNLAWILPDLAKKGARQLEELQPIFDNQSDHGNILEELKQISLYTDAFSDCKWSIPKDVISKDIAEMIINTAKILVLKGNTDMTTEAELKIYLKHIKPVWKSEMFKMKHALIACYQEAEDKGLINLGTTKRMIEFVL